MSAGHTPGQWMAAHRRGADGMYRTEVFSARYGGIATCDWTPNHCGNGVTTTFREANARLIAAAPDLLEALQRLIPHAVYMESCSHDDDGVRRDIERARAAIYKAEGAP